MKTRQQPHRKECMLLKKIANNAMSVSFSHRYLVIVVVISCLIHGLVTSVPQERAVSLCVLVLFVFLLLVCAPSNTYAYHC